MAIDANTFEVQAKEHLKEWGCSPDGDVFFTESSLLWPVKRGANRLMIKIADPDDDEARGAEILEFYAGRGAVKVIECNENIQLLERVFDSTGQRSLEKLVLDGKDDEATGIICDVIEMLHGTPSTRVIPDVLTPLSDRFDNLKQHRDEGRVRPEDHAAFQLAYALSDELTQHPVDDQILVHGDIHHFNVLYSDTRGWLAIDPKGFLAPRVYEYATPLCNPYMHQDVVADKKRMDRQSSIMSERSGLDRTFIARIAFVHAMQVVAWSSHTPAQTYWKSVSMTAAEIAGIDLPQLSSD